MADPSRYRDTGDDTGVGSDRGSTTGMPRWVKVSVIIAAILILLFGVLMLFGGGGGGHSPRRHGGAGGDTPPSHVIQDAPSGVVTHDGGHTGPPEGIDHG